MLYGWPQAFRLARVVAARWWLGLETPWSEPVSEVVGGRGGEQFLPVAVALAWRSSWELAGQRHLPVVVGGGTGNAWASPQAAETPRRLILKGGFGVDGGRDRRLEERGRWHGFEDLRGYLQARCDAGTSIPRIAVELGVRDWQVQAALSRLQVRLAPRSQRLAAQRRHHTEERIANRVAALGFAEVRAYLADRVVEQGWLLAEVAAELGAHRVTVRRLLDRYGIRRVRRTPSERAAAESGRRVQAVGWQARRAARLAELGFADLGAYLKARHVDQGWSVKRMRAELGVGRRWLVGELARLGLRP
jgi:transposase